MEKIIYCIMFLWYKIPSIKLRNPFIIKTNDTRSLEWFKERYEHGFDETELWSLSNILNEKINKVLGNSTDINTGNIAPSDFKSFLDHKQSHEIFLWFNMRLTKYIEWNCPFFFYDHEYNALPSEKQIDIANKVKDTVKLHIDKQPLSDEQSHFLLNTIFSFGW